MRLLVPCKRVPDTDAKIRVLADGTGIDHGHVNFIVNPFDAIALEEAIRIRDEGRIPAAGSGATPIEIVAVAIGAEDQEKELRTCLAMGADRALHVIASGPVDPWNIASLLAAVVQRESPDVVLMGKQAVDDDANQTGQFLAAILGWPQATFASHLEWSDFPRVVVSRETDSGIEQVAVTLPAVITADLRLNEPRYASLPSIMRARKKQIETISSDDLGVAGSPRVEIVHLASVGSERKCVMVSSAAELLQKLRQEAKVI